MVDWDSVALEIGLPTTWREQGYDSPEYMISEDSIYRQPSGTLLCVWPDCKFKSRDVEVMFRHVHGKKHKKGPS
jgi:hypothetical protein